jgi:myo-inositol-1(or 4)-monophosphatase
MSGERPFAAELVLAIRAARTAGEILRSGFSAEHQVRHKGEIDLVTETDEAAERRIVELIREQYPDDRVLAEEGTLGGEGLDRRWIVDPLDGTTNFAHGYPFFGVSIALEVMAVVEVGVVYQPILDELFVGVRGQGAWLNDTSLQVSDTDRLIASLLCSGFPYQRGALPGALELWSRVVKAAQAVRRDGSAALDLCYVAAGRFDGFWEASLNPWDVAAGGLIVQEAGGTVTDYQGRPYDIQARQILATNGHIHQAMVELLQG